MREIEMTMIEAGERHTELKQDIKNNLANTRMIAVHYPHAHAQHMHRIQALVLEQYDTYTFIVELTEEVDITPLTKILQS